MLVYFPNCAYSRALLSSSMNKNHWCTHSREKQKNSLQIVRRLYSFPLWRRRRVEFPPLGFPLSLTTHTHTRDSVCGRAGPQNTITKWRPGFFFHIFFFRREINWQLIVKNETNTETLKIRIQRLRRPSPTVLDGQSSVSSRMKERVMYRIR